MKDRDQIYVSIGVLLVINPNVQDSRIQSVSSHDAWMPKKSNKIHPARMTRNSIQLALRQSISLASFSTKRSLASEDREIIG